MEACRRFPEALVSSILRVIRADARAMVRIFSQADPLKFHAKRGS